MSAPLSIAALPATVGAKLPAVYERATQALAECTRIDECKDWADKAEALASYARQSKDDALRKMADRIQARAIRRCGELLLQMEAAQGRRTDKLHDGADTKLTRTQVAREAGLSERQKVTALRVASVPQPEFEAAVESESPPTVTRLAEQGKQAKPKPLHDLEGIDPALYPRATELQGKRGFLLTGKQECLYNIGMEKALKLESLQRAVAIAGGQVALAKAIGLKQGHIWWWLNKTKQASPGYVLAIEEATGVSKHDLRPDIFGPDPNRADLQPNPLLERREVAA